jgi:hypothetical protein
MPQEVHERTVGGVNGQGIWSDGQDEDRSIMIGYLQETGLVRRDWSMNSMPLKERTRPSARPVHTRVL